jgi:hypothetical protein
MCRPAAALLLSLLPSLLSPPAERSGPHGDRDARQEIAILERQLDRHARRLLRERCPDTVAEWLREQLAERSLEPERLAPLLRRRLREDPVEDAVLRRGILATGVPPLPPAPSELRQVLRALPRLPRNPASDTAIVATLPARGGEAVIDEKRSPLPARRLSSLPSQVAPAAEIRDLALGVRAWIRESIERCESGQSVAAVVLLDLDEALAMASSGWDPRRAKARATTTIRAAAPRLGPSEREALAAFIESIPPVERRFIREVRPLAGGRLGVELGTAAISSGDLRRWGELLRSPVGPPGDRG